MTRRLASALARIRALAAEQRVRLTLKARRELAEMELGMDEEDACDILASLTAEDSAGRFRSAGTGEWMYVFAPRVGGRKLYVKLVAREDCIVVSFHEQRGGPP